MRSLLERALVHLLNEEHEMADSLFRQYMIERARQIHSSLLQGEEVALSEGWEDSLESEEYFADGDLSDYEDTELDDATDTVEDDLDADTDELEDDMDADTDELDDDLDDDTDDVESRLSDLEDTAESIDDKLEQLTREFDEMMAKLNDEDDSEVDDEEEEPSEEDDLDVDAEDDMSDLEDDYEDDTENNEEEDGDEEEGEDETLDDITESVMAELEKVMVGDDTIDGEEVGNGKKIEQNKKSSLTMKKADPKDAAPIKRKNVVHTGYEREKPPVEPKMVRVKNRQKTNDNPKLTNVPKDGDSKAMLNKDFAGSPKKTRSTID